MRIAKSTDVTLSINGMHGIVCSIDLMMLLQFGIQIETTSNPKFYKMSVCRASDDKTIIKLLKALDVGYMSYIKALATI